MTRRAAAKILGVDPATVSRMKADGLLHAFVPACVPGERPQALFSSESVNDLRDARARALRVKA